MSFLANHFIKQSTNNDRHRELCYEKHLLTLTLSSILAIQVVSHAEFKGGFADIGVHYLDWTSRTTENRRPNHTKMILVIFEFEGGANFSWGEMSGSSTGKTSITVAIINRSEQRYTFKIPTVFTG